MEPNQISELSSMPVYEMRSFSRWLIKTVTAYFDDPDVQRRFEAWKKERECAALQAAAEGGVTGE